MNNQSVEVVMVKRIKGGWDREHCQHVFLSVEEVGKMISGKWGKKAEQLFKETKIGEYTMTNNAGS